MKLDVGCGVKPTGDVNLELYPVKSGHRPNQPNIPFRHAKNPVKGDALHLPFRTGSFSEVVANHVIEHVDDPFVMLKEMIRVANGTVEIYCPHRLHRIDNPSHRCHFTKTWFVNALKKLGIHEATIEYNSFTYLPHALIPLVRLPKTIHVKIQGEL